MRSVALLPLRFVLAVLPLRFSLECEARPHGSKARRADLTLRQKFPVAVALRTLLLHLALFR